MGERHLLSVVESFSEARQSRGLKMFWWNYNEGDEITPSKVMKLQQKWWNYTKGDEVITKVMKLQQSQRWWSYNEDDDYAWWEKLKSWDVDARLCTMMVNTMRAQLLHKYI